MKTFRKYGLAVGILALLAFAGRAGAVLQGETPVTNGFGIGEFGVQQISTSPAGGTGTGVQEARNQRMTGTGESRVAYTVSRSTFMNVASTTNTFIMNGRFDAPNVGGSTAGVVNLNVIEVATSSEPIHLKTLVIGQGLVTERIRIFDSRGSTDTSVQGSTTGGFFPLFDKIITSTDASQGAGFVPFDYDCSSGLVLMKGGTGSVYLFYDTTKRR